MVGGLFIGFTYIAKAVKAAEERIMAKIDESAQAVSDKADVLIAKVNETIVTLRELKEIVDNGQNTGNAEAVLAQVAEKVDAALADLTTAEDATDPTPDA